MSMRKLALALAENRPVYALHPYENGQQVFCDSIEETAKVYFKCLTDFDPVGPYILLGHSANGLYALELARLLRNEGKKVEFLGLLDTYPPGPVRKVNQSDRMKFHLNNLRKNNLSQTIKYLVRSAKRETNRWRQAVVDFKTINLRIHTEIKGDQHLLFKMYKPELYDGEVVLFSVNSRTPYLRYDPMEQWSTIITGSFKRIEVGGDHISLLDPPQVNQLAEKILTVLRRHETG
jgi:thioesterase domain-containing protein